jgi:fucose permease
MFESGAVLSSSDRTRSIFGESMLVIVASVVIFIYGMLASMLGTIVPSLGSRLALTNVEISYLALAQGIGLAATSVWAGALMDRSGKKIGVVLGLIASISGLLILTAARNLILGIVAMVVLGIGGSLVIVGANAIVSDVSDQRKAAALNFLNLFVGLGGMATPFIAGNILRGDAARVTYFGIGIAVLALVLSLVTPMRNAGPANLSVGNSNIFGNKLIYVLSAITLLYTACEFGVWNWLPRFLIASGVARTTALNILSLGFACGILFGRLGAARLLGRASPLAVTMAASIAMAITTFAMLHTKQPVTIAIIVFLSGIAMAPIFPTTIGIIGVLFKQRSATAIGFAITCGFSGLVLSSPVIGALSGSDPLGLGRGLLLIPALSIVIAVTLFLFRKDLQTGAMIHAD